MKKLTDSNQKLIVHNVKIDIGFSYRVLYQCDYPGDVYEGRCIWIGGTYFILKGADFEKTMDIKYITMISVDEE